MRIAWLSGLLALVFGASALAQPPAGWRTPTAKELVSDISWREEDPNRYLTVSADFDGDSQPDTAELVVSDKRNSMALFVRVSSNRYKPVLLDEIEDKRMIQVFGVALAAPGHYKTACGKGYFDCDKGEPESIDLKTPAIDYFKEGSANSFFLWDPRTKKFLRLWMSD